MVDIYSKVVMGGVTFQQSWEHVYENLVENFEKYGVPEIIQADNGGPFIAESLLFFNKK